MLKKSLSSNSNQEESPEKLLFNRLSNKWFLLLLVDLSYDKCRFNGLLKKHDGLSQKMLSQTLKNLEEDGLITRSVNGDTIPVEVTYKITLFGLSLLKITTPLLDWANNNVEKLYQARKRYYKRYKRD